MRDHLPKLRTRVRFSSPAPDKQVGRGPYLTPGAAISRRTITTVYSMRKPSRGDLETLLNAQRNRPFTYSEVGATADAELPPGYRHDHHLHRAGSGQKAFADAKAAVRAWAGHQRAGTVIHPNSPPLMEGTPVALALRAMGIWVTAVCRIVWVVDRPDAYGFAYGTLPHHPEIGEESFVARLDGNEVVVEIKAFSRPGSTLVRLAGPVGRAVQHRTINRYLDGLAARPQAHRSD